MPQRASVFLQFLHSSRPGSTRFGASVECWKRCFQGYEYKKVVLNVPTLNFLSCYHKCPLVHIFAVGLLTLF
jgi:hypothetical protein